MTYNFLDSLYNDLISMLDGIVIKRSDLARNAETVETARAFETYLSCVSGKQYIYTFSNYSSDIIREVLSGKSLKEPIEYYYTHPYEIPSEYAQMVANKQAEKFIALHEEKNEYYRTLMGLPPVVGAKFIYVRNVTDIPDDVPIHKMTIEQISRLEINGMLARIKREHPKDEYINYLGVNAIDFVEARLARPFEILRLGTCDNPRVVDMFMKEYDAARRYIMATVYRREQFTTKTLYDPIIGILMLTLAVRNTLVPDDKTYLNFEEILDAILESYGFLDYFQAFPFTYKRRLVLALDRLLKIKGTDGVLVDVCKLFSSDDLIANRYYIMKYQSRDDDGTIHYTGDPNQDYTLNFIRATIAEHTINTREENRLSYKGVTDNDYLWQLTPEETEKLLNSEFNLMMSKYVDIESAYDVSSLVFEVCCFLNLILYARDNIGKVSISNIYATGGRSSLFTMIIFLLATMAKRANFDGNIIYDPMTIQEVWGERWEDARVWRFNYDGLSEEFYATYVADRDGVTSFNIRDCTVTRTINLNMEDLDLSQDHITVRMNDTDLVEDRDYTLSDDGMITLIRGLSLLEGGSVDIRVNRSLSVMDELQKIIDKYELQPDVARTLVDGFDMDFAKPTGIVRPQNLLNIYVQNRSLYEAIQQEMNTTMDIRHYIALSNVKDLLYTSAIQRQAFIKGNENYAMTYLEMLEDLDPMLSSKVDGLEDEDKINSLIVYILERLEDMFRSNELKYLFLNTPTVYTRLLGKYIRIAINVFKASTVQLRSINTFFYLGDKDYIRVIDGKVVHLHRSLDDYIHVIDTVAVSKQFILDDYVYVNDKVYVNS